MKNITSIRMKIKNQQKGLCTMKNKKILLTFKSDIDLNKMLRFIQKIILILLWMLF